MKIFEVAGEGKLHGLTVMSLDAFVKKEDDVEESDISGVMHAAKHYNKSFLITAELAEGGKKTFRVRAQSERVAREKFDQHYNQARIISVKEEGVAEASKELPQWKKDWYAKQKPNSWPKHPQPYHDPDWVAKLSPEEREKLITGGLKEFALPGGGDGDSGRWYTDDELADIIGDDWFEDFDVSNDGFNIDAYGEKAKQNLVGYANSWFDDKGYNVHVMGVDHNDVDHDLKWYIVGSFQNDNFADKDINEAPGDFGLGANYRAIPDDEMQDLMGRSKNKTKTKRDKFDYPYIHGSNIEVKDEAGKKFDTEKLKAAIMTRPANILGQNAKMQHSETGTEAIFDIGLPALKGLAVNEKTGEFVVVDTCPGAGACQTYCYAMKGSYVMFKAVSMGLARMLNFLLNDPAGFADKLNSEIASARSKYAKKGARIVVRWHDAGDFFSPEYMDMAYGVARANPDVGFYAYTKMGDVANAARPANFNMNFSQGAKSGQEKKVNITRTKHSKVVPKDMFFDLIARKGNELIKDAKGRMQFASPENLDKFKSTLAQKYAIDKDSILTYDQMMKIPVGAEPKWNVIVMPGDGDNSANRNDVIGSYLLFH
jgi:hypothetical protein